MWEEGDEKFIDFSEDNITHFPRPDEESYDGPLPFSSFAAYMDISVRSHVYKETGNRHLDEILLQRFCIGIWPSFIAQNN